MANISNIETPDGSEYNLKDAISRRHLSYYGICTTAAATAAKVVTVDEDSFELQPGVIIGVHFSASNTADDVTLNVNNTGAKEIYYNNAVYDGHNTGVTGYAKRTIFYMYDGTHWVFLSQAVVDSNTDTKVRQTLSSGDANRPLLMAYSANTVTTSSVDNVAYRNNNIYANPSTGKITANGFIGDLEGDASTVNGHEVQQDIPNVLTFKFESAPQLIKTLSGNTVGKSYSYYDDTVGKSRLHITEFKFIVTVSNTVHHIIIDVPVDAITATEQTFRSGWSQTSSNGGGAYIAIYYSAVSGSPGIKEFSYNLKNCYLNGSDVTSASKVDVYIRSYLDTHE